MNILQVHLHKTCTHMPIFMLIGRLDFSGQRRRTDGSSTPVITIENLPIEPTLNIACAQREVARAHTTRPGYVTANNYSQE